MAPADITAMELTTLSGDDTDRALRRLWRQCAAPQAGTRAELCVESLDIQVGAVMRLSHFR